MWATAQSQPSRGAGKQLIGHRGASGYAPEHTEPAYKLAMQQKADFVEPDLAVSKDNVLVCLHDDTLERTTNVAEVFPDRASPEPPAVAVARLATSPCRACVSDAGKWFKPEFGTKILTFQADRPVAQRRRHLSRAETPPLYRSRGTIYELFVE